MRPFIVACIFTLAPAVSASAQFTFTSLDYPGATQTTTQGINNHGVIVGGYALEGNRHPMVIRSGEYSPVAPETILGSDWSQAYKSNDPGDKVGIYLDSSGFSHGFLLQQEVLTTIDYPGASDTIPFGINNSGTVVGYWDLVDAGGNTIAYHGFIWKNGTFTQFDYPGAVDTSLNGIDDKGDLIGGWDAGIASITNHGFLCNNGKCSAYVPPFPGAVWIQPNDINDDADIVGMWQDAGGSYHGFLLTAQSFTSFDYPGATTTEAWGINNAGQIVGRHFDSDGVVHGFLAQPSGCDSAQVRR
jgi:uncharacterized membrane protein